MTEPLPKHMLLATIRDVEIIVLNDSVAAGLEILCSVVTQLIQYELISLISPEQFQRLAEALINTGELRLLFPDQPAINVTLS